MAYLRCIHCGSKALVAASQCPKCAHPFNLIDVRGERVKLKRCRSCGIMHRHNASCHWCGDVPSGFTMPNLSAGLLRSAAAVALMITAVGGVWSYAPRLLDRPAVTTLAAASTSGTNGADAAAAGARADEELDEALAQRAATEAGASLAKRANAASVSDSIVWVPAVARTWVNVRNDASRGGDVVGVIKPASRAMLGTDRAGWRQVRSPDVSGWVDPRLFEADSLHTRGE